ncbi:hypothetical protein CAPTEDRAFT_188856 [Capitella teleta]|uniref:Apple domain-containing protein n=1 Tax=Capitella teleta TaxID=283909 RepID=R7TVG3_CAPTE|nr:hypothetical protein CAPTEDRAFT_188856 [Capitella teleta]|eukprot:ELT95005.1 hypothetical protein CAPTEDRAFT_188856 [Capitella teleta]
MAEALMDSEATVANMRVIGLLLFAIIVCEIGCQAINNEIFRRVQGKYFSTNHSLSVETFRSQLQCVLLCQRQKCCLSVLIRQETEGFSCRTLDSFIPIKALVHDAMGSYVYKTDPSSAADFTWRDPVNLKFILKFNIGISTGVSDVNLCLKKCNANPYCMSIEFITYKSGRKECNLNGISSKAAGSAYQKSVNTNIKFAKFQEKTCNV